VGEGRRQAGRFVTRDVERLRVLVIGRIDACADLVRQVLDALCLHIDLARAKMRRATTWRGSVAT